MSLVILSSQGNGTPTRFNCSFPNGIILEPNSQVCCMSWSAKRTSFDEGIAINSYNDSLVWTFQDCSTNAAAFPNVPFEKITFSHGNWDVFQYQALAQHLMVEMNNKEILSAFKGGWVWKYASNKFSVNVKNMNYSPMDKGLWRQYYGVGNPTIVNNPPPIPILSVAQMSPGDISMNYVVNQSPTVQLLGGEINNTNGAPGQPISAATVMGINTKDLDGVNQAVVLANMVGRYVTCVSTDTSTPGRDTTYAFIKILSVQTYVPPAPSPISAADIIQFNIQVLEQNLNIPNPAVGYNGVPFNWFMTEQLTLIFGGLSDPNAHSIGPDQQALNFYDDAVLFNTSGLNIPTSGTATDPSGYSFSIPIATTTSLEKLEGIVGGFITNQYFQYTEGTENTRNPDMDWSNRGGSSRAKVAYGWTIGSDFKLKALVGKQNQNQFSQTNYEQEEIDVSGIDLNATRNTIDVIIRPVFDSSTKLFGWELLYRFNNGDDYTVGHSLYSNSTDQPYLKHLPIRQVLSYKNDGQMPCNCKAIHNAGSIDTSSPPIWNIGMSISTQESFPDIQSDWLSFINDNATIGDTLNFFAGNYQENTGSPIIADKASNAEQELGSRPLLIQSPDLNVTGYCGQNGQTPQILQMCSGVNSLLSTQTLLYEQFTNNNWIELKNKTPINLTRLGIVITDVENKEVNFLEDTVVCLKFRTNNQNIKLGGF